jgi:hypothetical protein
MKRAVVFSMIAGCILLAPFTSRADISSATLTFRISQVGTFTARSITDERPTVNGCRVSLYSLLSEYDGAGKRRFLGSKRVRGRSTRTDFRATRLPPVAHVGTATDNTVQLNIQSLTTCDSSGEFARSAAFARLLDCGDTTQNEVSPSRFIRTLRERIQ